MFAAMMYVNFFGASSSMISESIDPWGIPRLHRAVYLKKLDKVKRLLAQKEIDVNKIDRLGRTALHYGCLAGAKETVEFLIKTQSDIRIVADRRGQSPVYLAIQNGHLDIVKMFFAIHYNFKESDNHGVTPLHYSINMRQPAIAEFLLRNTAVDLDAEDENASTPLHSAVREHQVSIVQLLSEAGAAINKQDKHGRTPLILAVEACIEECVGALLECGASLDIVDCQGNKPEALAELNKDEILLQKLHDARSRRHLTSHSAIIYTPHKVVDYSFSETDDDLSEEAVESSTTISFSQLCTTRFTDTAGECQELTQLLPAMHDRLLKDGQKPRDNATIDCAVPAHNDLNARQHTITNVQESLMHDNQSEGFLKKEEMTGEPVTVGAGGLITCTTADCAGRVASCVPKGRNTTTSYRGLVSPEAREEKVLAKDLLRLDLTVEQHRSERFYIETTPAKKTCRSRSNKAGINISYQMSRLSVIFDQIQDEFNNLVKENATSLTGGSKFMETFFSNSDDMNLQKASLNELKVAEMFVENLKTKLILNTYHELVDDVNYQEQNIRKIAIKDELREKVLVMLEMAKRENSILRNENEMIKKQVTLLAEERKNQRKSLKEHINIEAKLAISDLCVIELKEEIEDCQFKLVICNEEIKKLEFRNELMQRIMLKNEQMYNDLIGIREEKENSLKELDEKNELLKQYKMKMAESESCIKEMNSQIVELEKTRRHLEFLQEDAKSNRDHCKELAISNAKLQKSLHKSKENFQKLQVEIEILREEERKRMPLLPHNFDSISLSSNSMAGKSAANNSNIPPFGVFSDFAMAFEPEIRNVQARKSAVPGDRKQEEQELEIVSKHFECTTAEGYNNKIQETVQNIDDAEYLDCKGEDALPGNWPDSEPYSLEEHPTSSGAQWAEQFSKIKTDETGQFHEKRNELKIRALMHEAKTISELEEGTICVSQILRSNSKLASENNELHQQIYNLRKEHRFLQIKLSSGLHKKQDSTRQRESNSLLRYVRDKLKNESASACEENKRLQTENEQLKSALILKEKGCKSMNRKLILLKDKLSEHSREDRKLGILLRSLDEHIDYTYKAAHSQVSQRTKSTVRTLSSNSIACTTAESSNIGTTNRVQTQTEPKGRELELMASNTDRGIGDSMGLGKELPNIDSDRTISHSVADKALDSNDKVSLNERRGFEIIIESLQNSNERLTKEICDLKNTNKQIEQKFLMELKEFQIINSELQNKIKECSLIEEQMAGIREQNCLLELENEQLQKCIEEAKWMKTENEELRFKLETKANESINSQTDCSTNTDNEILKMLVMKSEERDALAGECTQLRQEIESITSSIEDLAENVTGISIEGQGVAAAIDFITSCCFEDREYKCFLEKELKAAQGHRVDHCSLRSYEIQKEEDSRKQHSIFECEKVQMMVLNDIQSECDYLRKRIIDLEIQNDDLYETNERLAGENNELELRIKTLHKKLQSKQSLKINGMECATNKEVEFEWSEIGQLITAKYERKHSHEDISATDKEYIKEQLIRLVEEYHCLKRNENLVKQQSIDNQAIRQKLAAETSKNNEMSHQLAKLALRERQFHEVKTRLSKACSARNVLQRDVQILTERVIEYEENYKNYKDMMEEFNYIRIQNDKMHGEKSKLEELVKKYRKVVKILQNKNEVPRNENETLEELECRKDIANIEDEFREEEKESQSQTY